MIESGTVLQNRYLIERQIGAGGMGAVYLAIDQRFESRVAIKETFYNDADLCDAFEREARLLNSLHHPVLPHVSDYFTEGRGHFLVMEYIEGEDLSEILKRNGAFQVKEVLRWADNLLDALDYLHSQELPITHRDIKPNNLKITPRGDIVLLDFGLAKFNSVENTGIKSVFGYSRRYSPLEQIQGTGTDARSDIFALGATLFHLLTGKPPIDTLARAAQIIAGNPDPLQFASDINPQVPLAVAQILQAALALNADRRFVSAKAMRSALEHAASLSLPTEVEDSSEELIAAIEPDYLTPIPTETENFPALEAFAAEAAEDLPELKERSKSAAVRISMEDAEALLSASEVPHGLVSRTDVAAQHAQRRPNDHLLTALAAVAAMLIWGGLAVWLVIGGVKSSEQPKIGTAAAKQSPVVVKTTVQQPAPVEVLPTLPEDLPAPIIEEPAVEEAAPKTTKNSTRTISEPKKQPVTPSSVKAETKETPARTESKKQENEVARQKTIQVSAPQRRGSGETRPRVVQQPPVSGIERVMTGSSSNRGEQRRDERRRRAEMSDAEKEDLRRRRTESVLRRNRQPIP